MPKRQVVDRSIWGYLSCILVGSDNGLSCEAAAHSKFEDSAAGRWATDVFYCLQTRMRSFFDIMYLTAQVRQGIGDSRDYYSMLGARIYRAI